jgi:hypothetical protein
MTEPDHRRIKQITPETSLVTEEIDAMSAAYEAMKALDKESARRAIRWLTDRLGLGVPMGPY